MPAASVDGEDADDVLVHDRGGGPRLAEEPRPGCAGGGQRSRQHLDRDVPVQGRIERLEHDPIPPAAQNAFDLVRPQPPHRVGPIVGARKCSESVACTAVVEPLRWLVVEELTNSLQALVAADQTVERVPAAGALLQVLLQADRFFRREPILDQKLEPVRITPGRRERHDRPRWRIPRNPWPELAPGGECGPRRGCGRRIPTRATTRALWRPRRAGGSRRPFARTPARSPVRTRLSPRPPPTERAASCTHDRRSPRPVCPVRAGPRAALERWSPRCRESDATGESGS